MMSCFLDIRVYSIKVWLVVFIWEVIFEGYVYMINGIVR